MKPSSFQLKCWDFRRHSYFQSILLMDFTPKSHCHSHFNAAFRQRIGEKISMRSMAFRANISVWLSECEQKKSNWKKFFFLLIYLFFLLRFFVRVSFHLSCGIHRQASDNGNVSISILSFTPTREDNGKVLICRAINEVMKHSIKETTLKLNIYCKYFPCIYGMVFIFIGPTGRLQMAWLAFHPQQINRIKCGKHGLIPSIASLRLNFIRWLCILLPRLPKYAMCPNWCYSHVCLLLIVSINFHKALKINLFLVFWLCCDAIIFIHPMCSSVLQFCP